MPNLGAAELIINEDGSIYHLGIKPGVLPPHIIVVGDPDRVPKVSDHFDCVNFRQKRREFNCHIGSLNGHSVAVISSGMGTDNVEILMAELHALFNVDFATRTLKSTHQPFNIYRIGTTGSVSKEIHLDSFIYSQTAIGVDSLMSFYKTKGPKSLSSLRLRFQEQIDLDFEPYAYDCSPVLQKLAADFLPALTVTTPGFYGPQGRFPFGEKDQGSSYLTRMAAFRHEGRSISNFEMETAGYYALAALWGHHAISFSAVLANRTDNLFSSTPGATVDALILKCLAFVSNLLESN